MLLSVDITDKSYGDKILYEDLHFAINADEKVGLIGRNGTGKSTLLNIITGDDKDYAGDVVVRRGAILVSSRQEHYGHEAKTVLEYIQGDLPEYAQLAHIIDTYPETMGSNAKKLQEFSDALERFSSLGYFQLGDDIKQAFEQYQIDPAKLHAPLNDLSGGQKRMVELIKVQRSRGHIALIDEPTNHMDYVAKAAFLKWLKAAPEAALIITHDRDVLSIVDRIIEIRDRRCFSFKGNYDAYLRNNTGQITNQVNEYDLSQRRIANLREDILRFRRLKERARDPGTIRRFKSSEQKAETELAALLEIAKPSFWIDQESASGMNDKLAAAYSKHKAQNIKVQTRSKNADATGRILVKTEKLSLGYGETPLFEGVSFVVREGERLRLHGRNGAGKSTLVNAVMSVAANQPLKSQKFFGSIHVEKELKIGHYEQEIDSKYLSLTLNDAIEAILRENNLPVNMQRVQQLLSDYLFNPVTDGLMMVDQLSGGQKARVQLIAMLINDPHILILDEPTNHLDLPSIEELENALRSYHGAVIYISHDSFFANKLGGETVTLQP